MEMKSYLVETASSRWLRVPSWFQKRTCLVDLPNDLALNIQASNGKIEVYSKNTEGIYTLLETVAIEVNALPKRKVPILWLDRMPIKQRYVSAKGR
jgi:hypothetical protein